MRHGGLPARRDDILRMAKIWLGALNTPKAAEWGVPPAERAALEPLVTLAKRKLTAVKYSPVSPVSNAAAGEIAVVPLNPLELPVVSGILGGYTVNGKGYTSAADR